MNLNKDQLDGIRKWIYQSEERKFSELTREHVDYLRAEMKSLSIPKDVVLLDKLMLIKILLNQQQTLQSLYKENEKLKAAEPEEMVEIDLKK